MGMPDKPSTKERIFFAGISQFARHGFEGATVRSICEEAGTANATAVNYYFGGKAQLYRAILDMAFAENRRRLEAEKDMRSEKLAPEEKLRRLLTVMVDVAFNDDPVAKDIVAIVLREMTAPTEHLDALVENFSRPDNEEWTAIMKEILGPDAPDNVVRDSLASVGGQIFYYMAFWPIFSRVYPEHPGVAAYREPLIDHVMRFSMAGLRATKEALEKGGVTPP
jgi:AcrR family transcriptional regulator